MISRRLLSIAAQIATTTTEHSCDSTVQRILIVGSTLWVGNYSKSSSPAMM